MFTLREMSAILGADSATFLPRNTEEEKPSSVVIDSRKAIPGCLFVCIKGENSDGHDFAFMAAQRGALAVLAERDPFGGSVPPVPVLRHANSVQALNLLASSHRRSFRGKVAGVTGSAGKTSVKEVLAQVLSVRGNTACNFMNLNNQVGLPLSMLNASLEANFWVMEAGISQKHDMDELGATLRPDLGLVLNVGDAHLAGLKDKGVAWHKTRLLTYMPQGGRALASADYPELLRESLALGVDLSLFSTISKDVDYYAEYLKAETSVTGRYRIWLKGTPFEMLTPFRGAYGAENTAAIAGAGHMLGLSPEEISRGFACATLPEQRFKCEVNGAFTLIDDSYNANPLSSARMLETAAEMAEESGVPLLLVMGEMFELGKSAQEAHYALGRNMAASRAQMVVWKGGQAALVKSGLEDGGFTGVFLIAQDEDEFLSVLPAFAEFARSDTGKPARGVIMFKGSRGNRLEKFVKLFRKNCFPENG